MRFQAPAIALIALFTSGAEARSSTTSGSGSSSGSSGSSSSGLSLFDTLERQHAMPPNPKPYRVTYDDGTTTPLLQIKMREDETDPQCQIWEETLDGFTVAPVKGKYVYVDVDEDTGDFVETSLVVGVDDPDAAHIRKDAATRYRQNKYKKAFDEGMEVEEDVEHSVPLEDGVPIKNVFNNRRLRGERVKEDQHSQHRRAVITSGTLKNLVIPFKFSDHTGRTLPTRSNLNTLMNNAGADPLCPTGSVRDLYLENSFNQLNLDSTVIDWVTLDFTEAYCTIGRSGLHERIHQCLTNALDKAVAAGVDFGDYDLDNNGFIDGITFFHSGYAAEFGGTDAYGTSRSGRIWSHKWAIYTTNWSHNGVRVYDYHINPSVWGITGTAIGRIGVVAHETGHFLGLPDLYDYGDDTFGDGDGIGSWGLMANSWGFDSTQYRPPLMSAWSKNVLGWVNPTVVSTSGSYALRQTCDFQDMIRIDRGFPSGQYLLIENRQPCGFEDAMPQGGLAIFYIDDNANNVRGYPGQGGWPGNGNHYEVALLQADGDYDMEKGNNRGDSTDLFHAGGVNSIGPLGTSAGDTYPNTKPYRSADHTVDLTISDISSAGETMTLTITFGDGSTPSPVVTTPAPTDAPVVTTPAPTLSPIASTFAPTLMPSLESCGDGVCQVSEGEGCGACSSDCYEPRDCGIISNPSSSLVYSSNSFGVVFDTTVGPTNLYFYGLKLYLLQDTTAKVYIKNGSYESDSNLNNWSLVFEGAVNQVGTRQEVEFQSRFFATAGSTVAFYVSFGSGGAFVYSRDAFSNNDLDVELGNTLRQQTGSTLPSTAFASRAFYEGIRYDYAPSTTPTPISPTLAPVASTTAPTASTTAPTASTTAPTASTTAPTASTTAPTASTTAPTASTTAPTASTLPPVASPTSTCNCCEEMKSKMEDMEAMLEEVMTMLLSSTSAPVASPSVLSTPAPISSSPASASCTDRLGRWDFDGVSKRWCDVWLQRQSDITAACEQASRSSDNKISDHCRQSCGTCNSTPTPIGSSTSAPTSCTDRTDRTDSWSIEGTEKKWCTWAGKANNPRNRCNTFSLHEDCPVTCGLCSR